MPVVQLVERPLTPKGKVGGSSPRRHYTHCTIFTRFYNQICNNVKTHDTIFKCFYFQKAMIKCSI